MAAEVGSKRKLEDDMTPSVKKVKKTKFSSPHELDLKFGWKLTVRKLETTDKECIPDLFRSIQDWKDFASFVENGSLGLIKDEYGVWRGGFIGYFYEEENIYKIPLFATSLHFRRQGFGKLLKNYIVDRCSKDTSILALAMDDKNALAFWKSLDFEEVNPIPAEIDNVLTADEKENLTVLKLKKNENILSQSIENFQKPEFKDMLRRYAETEEEMKMVEEVQKKIDSGEIKILNSLTKKELEEEPDEDEDDDNFDINEENLEEEDDEYIYEEIQENEEN